MATLENVRTFYKYWMDNLDKRKRAANITNEQRTLLIEYMTKHPKLTKGKISSSFTLKDFIHLWNEISDILNSVNGAKKDWKAATIGGTQNTDILTPQEEQVLDIMCPTSINGHPDILTSNIPEFTVN
ncbi:hypothetical protein RF55_20013 [Lasius niger]|uniref:Regulatory protein zeste n=1 Tax=Lasius niger TaxID=67767 RepID=A0A0J7MSG1_LASNI|nr:hypothetical protein RF55_20013 [Lasius niger]